ADARVDEHRWIEPQPGLAKAVAQRVGELVGAGHRHRRRLAVDRSEPEADLVHEAQHAMRVDQLAADELIFEPVAIAELMAVDIERDLFGRAAEPRAIDHLEAVPDRWIDMDDMRR